jgi:mRNA-degrading endonuclease toxin of MazEF toxin-antitoxin module
MAYLPQAGDLIWVDFDPQAGRKQAKKSTGKPVAPLSSSAFHRPCLTT